MGAAGLDGLGAITDVAGARTLLLLLPAALCEARRAITFDLEMRGFLPLSERVRASVEEVAFVLF